MSEKAAAKEVEKQSVEPKPTIVVSAGKPKLWRSRRTIILAGLVLCLAALIIIVAVHHTQTNSTTAKPAATKKLTPQQQAETAIYKGNYAAAQKIYDAQLKKASTKPAQAAVYGSKATTALSANDNASALAFAKQADTLHPTYGSSLLLGNIAEAQGDNKAAAGYFQMALNRLDKNSPTYGYEANKIQARINEVSK